MMGWAARKLELNCGPVGRVALLLLKFGSFRLVVLVFAAERDCGVSVVVEEGLDVAFSMRAQVR